MITKQLTKKSITLSNICRALLTQPINTKLEAIDFSRKIVDEMISYLKNNIDINIVGLGKITTLEMNYKVPKGRNVISGKTKFLNIKTFRKTKQILNGRQDS